MFVYVLTRYSWAERVFTEEGFKKFKQTAKQEYYKNDIKECNSNIEMLEKDKDYFEQSLALFESENNALGVERSKKFLNEINTKIEEEKEELSSYLSECDGEEFDQIMSSQDCAFNKLEVEE